MRRLYFDKSGGVSGSGEDSCNQDLTALFGALEIVIGYDLISLFLGYLVEFK